MTIDTSAFFFSVIGSPACRPVKEITQGQKKREQKSTQNDIYKYTYIYMHDSNSLSGLKGREVRRKLEKSASFLPYALLVESKSSGQDCQKTVYVESTRNTVYATIHVAVLNKK